MRLRPALLPLLALTAPLAAQADSFNATRSEELVEKRHEVVITMHADHATMRVRRTVWNGAAISDQATFMLDLPDGAAATGLRTLAYADGQPIWYAGELMEAEAAAQKYRELTGIGGFYPKDPALLSWRKQGTLALQVFPCLANQEKTVEYTLTLPTKWTKGQSMLSLPTLGTGDVTPDVVVQSSLGKLLIDGEEAVTTDLSAPRVITLEPRNTPIFSGLLAKVPVDDELTLAAYRVSAAKQISTLPEKARIVLLLDTSRSIDDDELAAYRTAAKAALSHFASSDVKVHVASFNRTAVPLTDGFVSVADAETALDQQGVARGNGSEVEVAMRHAQAVLATAPVDAARRVILFSDLATREKLTPELAAKATPRGGVLHLVSLSDFGMSLDPEEDSPWSSVPRATGGLFFRGGANPNEDADEAKRVFEELVRPTRLHKVVLRSGATVLDTAPAELLEGESFDWRAIGATSFDKIGLSAELWSKPIAHEITPDAGFGRREAALAFGNELHWGLNDEQMMKLATYGGAVSPVTSYLAIEPGVRPSTEGLEDTGMGIGSGSGRLGGSHRTKPPALFFDTKDALIKLFKPLADACGGGITSVTVEATWREIVEVTVVVGGEAASSATRSKCMQEAVWGVDLPVGFDRVHQTVSVGPF